MSAPTRHQLFPGERRQWGTVLDLEAVCEVLDSIQEQVDRLCRSFTFDIQWMQNAAGVTYASAGLLLREVQDVGLVEGEGFGGRVRYTVRPARK